MYLLKSNGVDWVPHRVLEPEPNSYAILSHRWREGEVEFKDIGKPGWKDKPGYRKIERLIGQTVEDGLDACWIDTCCIDQDSSAELSEAINSMYRWYQEAKVCYAYLDDVDSATFELPGNFQFCGHFPTKTKGSGYGEEFDHLRINDLKSIGRCFDRSEWFQRGWTLQELLAPTYLTFYDKHWNPVATREQLASMISHITGISQGVLKQTHPVHRIPVAQRMSWAAGRKTTRPEDVAYSLFGIFDVNMPMLYGEGRKAFRRLQEEILRSTGDHSLLCWQPDLEHNLLRSNDVFADSPQDFKSDYSWIAAVKTNRTAPSISCRGLEISLPLTHRVDSRNVRLGLLDVKGCDSKGEFLFALNLIEAELLDLDLEEFLAQHHPRAKLTQRSSGRSESVYLPLHPRLQKIRTHGLRGTISFETIQINRWNPN